MRAYNLFISGPKFTKFWSISSACANLRGAPLRGLPGKKLIWVVQSPQTTCRTVLLVSKFVLRTMSTGKPRWIWGANSVPKFTGLFSSNAVGIIAVEYYFFRFWISIRSGDVRDESLKLSEVNPNFARFWPPNFVGKSPQILGPGLQKWTYFPSRGKDSRRPAEEARRFRGEKERKENKET